VKSERLCCLGRTIVRSALSGCHKYAYTTCDRLRLGAGLRRRQAKASWAYLFRMINLLSSSSLLRRRRAECAAAAAGTQWRGGADLDLAGDLNTPRVGGRKRRLGCEGRALHLGKEGRTLFPGERESGVVGVEGWQGVY